MSSFNSFNIPLDQINEREGTIVFTLKEVNLYDKLAESVVIFDLPVGDSRLTLERDRSFNLKFTHRSLQAGVRLAKVDLNAFSYEHGLFIAATWSDTESTLSVGEAGGSNLVTVKGKETGARWVKGKDGSLFQLGDEGVTVMMARVVENGKVVLEPKAKEIFDFAVIKAKLLLDNCQKLGDFLFETTSVQQCIVMLVTGFEIYCRARFLEMEEEGWTPDFDNLCRVFLSNCERKAVRQTIEKDSQKLGKTPTWILVNKRRINFQSYEDCKRAYNKGYGIKFGKDLGLRNYMLKDVQRFIDYRHNIIHAGSDLTMLNRERVPTEEPIFANKVLGEKAGDTFQQFVDALHKHSSSRWT
jgi:hypothetical protein